MSYSPLQKEEKQKFGEVIEEILRAIEQVRFGSIEITVHEGRVTQIERREKIRFNLVSSKN
ncbi:MAG TPA: YezD family protein [Methylophilaceae bacterium]|nr:YezD family protein [Methylophilaceae bacterium]